MNDKEQHIDKTRSLKPSPLGGALEGALVIVGQGICGTLLSYFLVKAGKKVLVIDEGLPVTSTRIASGLINPVTGKRLKKSWMYDELLPVALQTYRELEEALSVPLLQQCDMLDFHATRDERDLFEERVGEETYLGIEEDRNQLEELFRFNYGVGKTSPCWLVDLDALLAGWRKKLVEKGMYLQAKFDWKDCVVEEDRILYKGIEANKLILCEGATGYDNPYFSKLPYSTNKGEVIIASIPGLPPTNIYKQGIKIVPWKDDLFWIGSSFEWDYDNVQPTTAFRQKVEEHLNYWLKLPYEIKEHYAALRPSTVGQQLFVGFHPVHASVGILNGTGTKGCSLAPFFAKQFADHITENKPIMPEASVGRFGKILSR